MPHALIVANQLPGHDLGFEKSGHGMYLSGILDFLRSRGYEITLLSLRPSVDFVASRTTSLPARVVGPDFISIGKWTLLKDPRAIAVLAAWNIYKRLPRFAQTSMDRARKKIRMKQGNVHNFGTFITPAEIAYLRRLVARLKPDLILYDSVYNVCDKLSDSPHWIITHEIKHQRMDSFRAQGLANDETGLTAEKEAELLGKIGKLIAIQWDDGEELKRLVPGADVVVTPVTMQRAERSRDALEATRPHCVFIGSGSYHNLDGIEWFLENCWPLIRTKRPDATLDVCGTVCYRLEDAPPGVTFRGVVEQLVDAYAGAAVTIVPLRIGSGLKIKLAEALSLGKAVVTTSVGAQGLLAVNPAPFLRADTAHEFAEAVLRLFDSPELTRQLQTAAWEFSAIFEKHHAFKELDAVIHM
jgi:glycosyltransferase involved in cell wall biosynthesis